MNRIEDTLRSLQMRGQKALTFFLTAGYPDRHSAPDLVFDLIDAGTDIIELGMPFSDPMADGPIIQRSSQVALKNGMTLSLILEDVRKIRTRTEVPIVLMGYLNPILRYGADRFFRDAALSGVDGLILPELPLEENGRFAAIMNTESLSNILLVTPTTSESRVRMIDAACHGFLYCVSRAGVTGADGGERSLAYVRQVRRISHNPVLVGFGIATAADAEAYAGAADGIIVGSALIRRIETGAGRPEIRDWARVLSATIHRCST